MVCSLSILKGGFENGAADGKIDVAVFAKAGHAVRAELADDVVDGRRAQPVGRQPGRDAEAFKEIAGGGERGVDALIVARAPARG